MRFHHNHLVIRALVSLIAVLIVLSSCHHADVLPSVVPPYSASKLQILAKLRNKDFTGLDDEFEQYQRAFEVNPTAELNEKVAFDAFATDDPAVDDQIAAWIKARPDSFAAHMAMGNYLSWRGWHTRGPATAAVTPAQQLEAMREFFLLSVDDLRAALKLKPKLAIAYAVLISEARGQHELDQLSALRGGALEHVPDSFIVREQIMESLYPRWGGTHELMADFAAESQAQVNRNPFVHWLLGFVDSDEGETLGLHGEYDGSVAALTEAIEKGGDYSGFYFNRGISYGFQKFYGKALQDFDRADELFPQDPELLMRRAYAYAMLRKAPQALADLEFVKHFEEPDDSWNELHDWAVKYSTNATR